MIRGRSSTILTKYSPLLATYPTPVDIGQAAVIRKNLYSVAILSTTTYLLINLVKERLLIQHYINLKLSESEKKASWKEMKTQAESL